MKHSLYSWRTAAGILLWVASASAQTPDAVSEPGKDPSAKRVVARHVRAVGGSTARQQRSYHYAGTVEVPGKAKGTLEIFGRQPHKFWLKVAIPGGGRYLRATDGQTMWHFDPQTGYRTREDWEYHAHQGLKRGDDEQQHRLTEMLDLFATPGSATGRVARAQFNGRSCFELQFRRRPTQIVREYFDTNSGLRVGATYAGTNAETFLIDDYKEFEGIKIGTRLTRITAGKTNDILTIASVEFIDVPDSKFAMPIHVPEWPEGWNQIDERYPPGFARGTLPWPWKGEHNRWFSPGFGRTNDAFFWSYVVFNSLEGDTLNFAAELQDALHRYDASLYGKAYPPEKIKVTVGLATMEEKLGHEVTHRSAVIDGFDAESSKKELRTYVETFRWYCPTVDRTAFVVLRSPRAYSRADQVWTVLEQFRDAMICHHAPVHHASMQERF